MIEEFSFVLEDEKDEKHQYRVNQLGGMKSFILLQKLVGAFKSAGGDLITESGGEEASALTMGTAIIGALGDKNIYDVVEELFSYKVYRDDKKLNPDEDFRGNMLEMAGLVVELVMINWGHLFENKGKLTALFARFKKQA